MIERDDGGRAFPHHPGHHESGHGMTLRDYFAAKAMQGLVAHSGGEGGTAADYARWSYEFANAMLAERAK